MSRRAPRGNRRVAAAATGANSKSLRAPNTRRLLVTAAGLLAALARPRRVRVRDRGRLKPIPIVQFRHTINVLDKLHGYPKFRFTRNNSARKITLTKSARLYTCAKRDTI